MSRLLTTSEGVITIRPAVPAEAAAVRELRLEALALHPKAFAADHGSGQAAFSRWKLAYHGVLTLSALYVDTYAARLGYLH